MNSAGNNKKAGYLVIALLLVGLTAYSNAVKDLTEIQRLALGANQLIAQWSTETVPAEIPSIPQTQIPPPQIPQAIAKLETCESRLHRATPSVVAPVRLQEKVETSKRSVRVKPTTQQIAKAKKATRFEFDAADFAYQMSTQQFPLPTEPVSVELPLTMFKAKARKFNNFRINPRDREMLLKTLNRSINLRSAG